MTKRKPPDPSPQKRGPRQEPGLKQTGDDRSNPTFEAAMGDLEGIVRRLEEGGESLEKALHDYSRALGLLKVCHQKLDAAERQVEVLSGIDAEGNPITQPVEDVEETMEEKRHSRAAKRTAAKNRAASSRSASDAEGLF